MTSDEEQRYINRRARELDANVEAINAKLRKSAETQWEQEKKRSGRLRVLGRAWKKLAKLQADVMDRAVAHRRNGLELFHERHPCIGALPLVGISGDRMKIRCDECGFELELEGENIVARRNGGNIGP